jgi:hypothetical protein
MRKILFMLALISPISAFAQVIHLDCTAKVDKIFGEDLYGKSSDSIGDTKGPYLIDIDFDNGTGKVGNWSSDTFSVDPNDPTKIMQIDDLAVGFGIMPPNGDWGMQIDRENLKFFAMIGYGATEVLMGECVLVEKREAPKRAF